MVEPAYLTISLAKCKERESKIPQEWRITLPEDDDNLMGLPRECGIFSEEELAITETVDSVALLEKIHSSMYTSLEVTKAFCKRAAVAQQALNCLTEIFFEEALSRARFLDEEFQRTGRPVGPLHGLPISLKDSINIAGVDSTIGMTGYAFQPEKENSVIVDILLKLGAVLYVKTNVPQSMMTPDTQNFTFGQSRNARSKHITASGSSGGLGALVGFRGSLLGIGTDVGGSVRIPAYSNGVYGVKPSSGRLPYHLLKGYLADGADTVGILCVNGVIASSMRDCELLLRVVSQAEPWLSDPSCAFLPWPSEKSPPRTLTFGVIREDHETQPLPPVKRVLDETVAKLRAEGHEIIEIEFFKSAELAQNALDHFKVDGGKALERACNLTGEPYTLAVQQGGLYPCEAKGLEELYAYSAKRACLQHDWLQYWAQTAQKTKSGRPIDAILCPAQSSLPRPHETLIRSHFTRNWNVLDYPAALVQVGKVDLARDSGAMPVPKGPMDERVQSIFTPEKRGRYEDFPVGLQLVCQRQMEPKLMELALMLESLCADER